MKSTSACFESDKQHISVIVHKKDREAWGAFSIAASPHDNGFALTPINTH